MTLQEFVERVWNARQGFMRDWAIPVEETEIWIAIEPVDLRDLRIEFRKTWPNTWGFHEDLTDPTDIRVFGIPVRTSADLAPGEIRFRQEFSA